MNCAVPSESYKALGQQLINDMPELAYIKTSEVKISFLVSDQNKKENRTKPVYAETEKIPDKYKWGMPADFSITVYYPNVAAFSEKQRQILIFQQLLKIGIDFNADAGQEKYFLVEPDVNDFSIIIKKYGTDWQKQPELFDQDDDEPGQSDNGFEIFN